MSRRRRGSEGESARDTTSWMATFSDLNFLMITFFVLLLSMSSMDHRRFSDVFGDEISMAEDMVRPAPPMGKSPLPVIIPCRGRWVGYPQDPNASSRPGRGGDEEREGEDELQKGRRSLLSDPASTRRDEALRRLVQRWAELVILEEQTEEEVRLTVEDALFFESDEYRPDPRAIELLRSLARLTAELDGVLRVEAHLGTWELAARRSAAVARALVGYGVPGDRVTADVIAGAPDQLNFALALPISQVRGGAM